MKKLVTTLCAAVILAAFATPGLAAPAKPKVEVFNLLGSEIEGTLLTPKGTFIQGGAPREFDTLIEYRKHFEPEMFKLTEEL